MIRHFGRDVLLWLPVGLIPIVNGLVRVATYQSALGEPAAGWVSASLDCALILGYALCLRPPRNVGLRAATWLFCTTMLHFALGALAFGMPLRDLLQKYDLSSGEPWLLVNLAIAAAPWIGAQLPRRGRLEGPAQGV